jgi:hypothetical protein
MLYPTAAIVAALMYDENIGVVKDNFNLNFKYLIFIDYIRFDKIVSMIKIIIQLNLSIFPFV